MTYEDIARREASGSPISDRDRWEACGRPEIICADDGFGDCCYYAGVDDYERCCELCGRDEPAEETGECPNCKKPVWWVPRCPRCGSPATWTYGEIKPLEFEKIRAKEGGAA